MFTKYLKAGRLARPIVVAGLIGGAALAVAAGPATSADAATTCASSCVTNLETQPQGLSMGVTFDTTVPTTDALYVYRAGNLIVQSASSTATTHHKLSTVQGLAANTSYSWHLVVTDSAGNQAERTGNLTTLHRRVTVQFVTDTVTNDSDDSGPGEFRTHIGVADKVTVPLAMPEDIDSGQTVAMGATMQQVDAGTATAVHAQMYDSDYSLLPGISGAYFPVAPITWNNGSCFIGDWASASGTLDTWYPTNGLKSFQLQVNANVGFVVRGLYSVDFVA